MRERERVACVTERGRVKESAKMGDKKRIGSEWKMREKGTKNGRETVKKRIWANVR